MTYIDVATPRVTPQVKKLLSVMSGEMTHSELQGLLELNGTKRLTKSEQACNL